MGLKNLAKDLNNIKVRGNGYASYKTIYNKKLCMACNNKCRTMAAFIIYEI